MLKGPSCFLKGNISSFLLKSLDPFVEKQQWWHKCLSNDPLSGSVGRIGMPGCPRFKCYFVSSVSLYSLVIGNFLGTGERETVSYMKKLMLPKRPRLKKLSC